MNALPSLTDIETELADPAIASLPPFRIAVLRNVTVESLEPYLKYLAYRQQWNASVTFAGYDTIIQEATGSPSGLLGPDLHAVLVFSYLETLSPDLTYNFSSLDLVQREQEINRLRDYFQTVIQGIRRQTDATILWHGLETPIYPSLGIRDAQGNDGQSAAVAALNASLRETLSQVSNAFFVDIDACVRRIGAKDFYDLRFWHLAQAPYTRAAAAEIASEEFKFFRNLKGRNKKCLVLDCDNTLWGGVVGEDGLNGIKLGGGYPGSAFSEFQREIVSLYHRGVILALCSKNNEEDVWEVFDRHPDRVLRREHIAAWRINWKDKAANIRELAAELNIGLDSIVFAEDSEFEAGLVREHVPEVEVLLLPKDRPVEYKKTLASCGFFDTVALTEEDRNRGKMYREESARRQMKAESGDLASYYRSLEMRLELGLVNEFTIPRIAQQTQKVNQFNLTTRRYNDADIARFAVSKDHEVYWLRVADRFGDLGIVGTCIVKYEADRAEIETFLLSCRALGRGIEKKFLAEVLERARKRGAKKAVGEYLKTQKNAQTETFYAENGFTAVTPEAGDRKLFVCPLETLPLPLQKIDYFAEVIRA